MGYNSGSVCVGNAHIMEMKPVTISEANRLLKPRHGCRWYNLLILTLAGLTIGIATSNLYDKHYQPACPHTEIVK